MGLNDINFSKLFLEKHGNKTFEEIISIIKQEKKDKCDNNYIENIFKVAFFRFLWA